MLAVVLVVAAVGATGCSDAEGEKPSGPAHPAATAVRDLQDAAAEGDTAAICDLMTAEAREQAGRFADGRSTTCARDVKRVFEIMEGGRWVKDEGPAITHVDDTLGTRATVTVEKKDERWKSEVELVEQGGTWKLAGFFGIPPKEFATLEKNLRTVPFKEYGTVIVEAFNDKGVPCRDLRDRRHPKLTGGCAFWVSGMVPIRILTPFGAFKLSECNVRYRGAVAPWGHAYANEVDFATDWHPRCKDITPCVTEEGEYRPWTGHIDIAGAPSASGGRDREFEHHMLICLRTSAGLFGGEFVTRLLRDGKGGWTVEPSNEGATGVKIDGELAVTGKPFDLRPRPAP